MSTINQSYVNALLADAAYVDVTREMTIDELKSKLVTRMTPTLAEYLVANFEIASVVNSSDTPLVGSGFDATVWRGKVGGDYAGQVFVSMRGTEPPPVAAGADLLADGDLATSAGARYQIMDMVNWWLRESTPTGQLAKQIKWDQFRRTDPSPLSNAVDPGFVEDAQIDSTGFEALRTLDVNHDNLVNASDAAFTEVRLWKDIDQDGISQSNELFTLAQKNIASQALNCWRHFLHQRRGRPRCLRRIKRH